MFLSDILLYLFFVTPSWVKFPVLGKIYLFFILDSKLMQYRVQYGNINYQNTFMNLRFIIINQLKLYFIGRRKLLEWWQLNLYGPSTKILTFCQDFRKCEIVIKILTNRKKNPDIVKKILTFVIKILTFVKTILTFVRKSLTKIRRKKADKKIVNKILTLKILDFLFFR